jgi:hypothetical protein
MPRESDRAPLRLTLQLAGCAGRVLVLLSAGRLHRHPALVDRRAHLPDGREFVVFRATSCEEHSRRERVTLAVWFRLHGVPPGARVRRYLFERESILNTLLYAGFDGYRVKLWMVDPATSEYAGLYEWAGRDAAERYARYITGILAPLSVPGTVGYELVERRVLSSFLLEPAA